MRRAPRAKRMKKLLCRYCPQDFARMERQQLLHRRRFGRRQFKRAVYEWRRMYDEDPNAKRGSWPAWVLGFKLMMQ